MDGQSQEAQDARVERLWQTLDIRKDGQLDINGLKNGLRKIDHPLKHADALLKDVLDTVDTSGDGRIQYSEFRTFVKQTEKELLQLFKSIDRDRNGLLDKSELQSAFVGAGIVIPNSKLEKFFSEVDTNHDGVISFDEWRNFLLFMPTPVPSLKAVLSYYSSTVSVNPEGDVHITNETVHGLGRRTFPTSLFGSFAAITKPPRPRICAQQSSISEIQPRIVDQGAPKPEIEPSSFPWNPGDENIPAHPEIAQQALAVEDCVPPRKAKLLTDLLPEPGYFLAGGIAGVVSRTATAPLDRLKVYLIAHVGIKDEAISTAKSGDAVKAAKIASRPLFDAAKTLWRMGGVQSMFAGNGLNVVKIMPESAIKFGSYEGSRRILARFEGHADPKALHPWSQFVAAGMGGIISQFCIYPLDTLKFRMQCETTAGGLHGNALIIATARKMFNVHGLRSFYRGLPMGLVGMFPYSAIDLTTFEYLKRFHARRSASQLGIPISEAPPPSNFTTAGIGAFSGAFGASIVYPINLLRTRLQSQGTVIHPQVYTGVWDVARKTVKVEGWRGLFKGITPNLLKVVPAVSITYVVYDNMKRAMGLN